MFSMLLSIHIGAGFLALVVAPAALASRKGSTWHRRWGKIYFYGMLVVTATAVPMALMRSGLFLLLAAVFSFYLAYTGYRTVLRKNDVAPWHDRAVAVAGLAGGLWLIAFGGIVAAVFGVIATYFAAEDLYRFFIRPSENRMNWMITHLGRMLSAYAATVTAFSVVNFRFLPAPVRWLWPSVIATVAISVVAAYYRKKLAPPLAPASS